MSLTSTSGRRSVNAIERFLRRRHRLDQRAQPLQQQRQHVARVGIVFDDQDMDAVEELELGRSARSAGRPRPVVISSTGASPVCLGNFKRKVVPFPSPPLSTVTVPPCSSTRCRTIAMPRPKTVVTAAHRAVGLAEAIEDERQELRRNADAGVDHLDVHVAVLHRRARS